MAAKGELVYSTSKNVEKKSESSVGKPLASGPAKMRLESKGRAGKQVTVLFNLPLTETAARDLMRTLQSQMGTGGTFKDGTIEFRGDVRDRVEQHFKANGIKLVRAGG